MTRPSIIIVTHNRCAQLKNEIELLRRQTIPQEQFEIIVIDDGSTDDTGDYLSQVADVRSARIENSGPAKARNAGATMAREDVLIFLDDDCMPHATWLEEFLRSFQRADADALGGSTSNALPLSVMSECYHRMTDAAERLLNSTTVVYCTGNHFGIRANVFRSIGGFSDEYRVGGEDRDLVLRMSMNGYRVAFDAQISMPHAHRFTATSFLRHFWKFGEGSYILRKKFPPSILRPANVSVSQMIRMVVASAGPPWDMRSPFLLLLACLLQSIITLSFIFSWITNGRR